MRLENKISSIDDKYKKIFFNKIFKRLRQNNLLKYKCHQIIGTNIFENSFFKDKNLLKCLNNNKDKNFFFFTYLIDMIKFLSIIFKILIFKLLTPMNQTKKSKKKSILVTTYLPQSNFFKNSNFFFSYQWGENLDNLKSNYSMEYIHIYPLNYSTLKIFITNFFKTIIFKNSNHLFILNYISVREILSLSLKTIFRGIRIKSKDPIDDYINVSLKPYNLVESRIWDRIFKNFFKFNKEYEKCFYLFENQNWEKFLKYHWKYYINKDIFPFNHSICRYNDLRIYTNIYFNKFKIFKDYFPDKLLINDKISYKNIKTFDKKFKILKIDNNEKEIKLKYKQNKIALVIGDINLKTSEKLLNITHKLKEKNFVSHIIFKPHPSNINKVYNDDYEIYSNELKYFNKSINYIFCANTTTTVAKIYKNFSNIFIYIPKNEINLSPFFNFNNKLFYSNYQKLIKMITNNSNKPFKKKNIYFKQN